MRYNVWSKRCKSGFTLVEMLVVIVLIAIVATIAIALLGGATQDAAESVNHNNIKHMTSLLGSYQQLHQGQLPNKVDSLLDSDKINNGSYPHVAEATRFAPKVEVIDNPGKVLYVGLDTDQDGECENPTGTSRGIYGDAWSGHFASLTVSKLTTNDVKRLQDLGITTVLDLYTTDGNLFNGTERYQERDLKVGDPVVVVDPRTSRNGKGVYEAMGFHDITNTDLYPNEGDIGLSDTARLSAMQTARYLVFGIGPKCSMVGSRKAGVQEAPRSKILPKGYYDRYLMVVKIGNPPVDVSADLAGVLDPQGNTSYSADSWATRTGN